MNKLFLAVFLLLITALSADMHTVGFQKNISFDRGHEKVEIAIDAIKFWDLGLDNSISLSGNFLHNYAGKFNTSMGAGFRHAYKDFSLGVNTFWDCSNYSPVVSYQVSAGLELCVAGWNIFYNGYFPLSYKKETDKHVVLFNDRTEFGVSKLFDKIEVCIAPVFHHKNGKTELKGRVRYHFPVGVSVGVSPSFDSQNNVSTVFSIAWEFGKSKFFMHKKPERMSAFQYDKISKAQEPEPVVHTHIVYDEPVILPIENPPVILVNETQDIITEPHREGSWYDFFL